MMEQTIFWAGRKPRVEPASGHLADSPEFVDGIGRACAARGCPVQRFISAQGPYGTWLAELDRGEYGQRVLWNGKERQLVLQVRRKHGGWDEPKSLPVADISLEGFVAAVTELLGDAMDRPDDG